MKTIYTDNKYKISADVQTGSVTIENGIEKHQKKLCEITSMPEEMINMITKMNKNPDHFLYASQGFCIHKGALKSWENARQEFQNYKKETAEKERQHLLENVPGLIILQSAVDQWNYYFEVFNRAMEDEYNDGVSMPIKPTSDIDQLKKEYPRAAAYVKADNYLMASNFLKSSAGATAMKILGDGGPLEEANNVLENWLPPESVWL